MTLTKDMIDRIRFDGRMEIDAELEATLLERFGEEPYPEAYSEQDMHEQVRKYVNYYNERKKTVSMIF
jgi:hypothetical protein